MKRYKVHFKFSTWTVDTYAASKEEAYNKARQYAEDELGYDTVKYAHTNVEKLVNK